MAIGRHADKGGYDEYGTYSVVACGIFDFSKRVRSANTLLWVVDGSGAAPKMMAAAMFETELCRSAFN